MSEERNKRTRRKKEENQKKKKPKRTWLTILKVMIVLVLLTGFIAAGAVGGLVLANIKSIPNDMDFAKDIGQLEQYSTIYDEAGNFIEKVQTKQYRKVIELNEMPDHLINAVVAIEDERFREHIGVDPKGILRAAWVNVKERSLTEGASTITQQLARNFYLGFEKKLDRKIKEAYIAIQMERSLTKDEILKAYLNTINLGKGAYGVYAAAETYFSKEPMELTLAESALIAGIQKSPTYLSPYKLVKQENVDSDDYIVQEEVELLGEKYVAVFNESALDRQRVILAKMKELGIIDEAEYQEALSQDIKASLNLEDKKNQLIETSYFTDYVKTKVVNDLVATGKYSHEEAQNLLYTGGLQVYSTMDINLQSSVESIYNNFVKNIRSNYSGLDLIKKYQDGYGNIIDSKKRIVYYKKSNLVDENYNLKLNEGSYQILDNGDLAIKSPKLYYANLSIPDFYSIDTDNNLVTHPTWQLDVPKDSYVVDKDNQRVIIKASFIKNAQSKNLDFYTLSDTTLLISSRYFYINKEGIVQPQSSVVIMDHKNGHISAMVGGRDLTGNKILNRATTPRQPGSSIKPIAVYLPALDNGFTAADIIDDTPNYDRNGNRWPQNWYERSGNPSSGYKGLVTLRHAVEQSINVVSVKTLKEIGIDTSVEYLQSLGVIDTENPTKDSFITREESSNSDEDLAPLALGGMGRGISPLRMTAAYSAIANRGIYSEPVAYTKVLDRNGDILLENKPIRNTVVTPQVAYTMTDILKSAVTTGTGKRAQIFNLNTKIPVAGKTGTTQNQADAWFVGYTPYLSAGVWIGNDSPAIKLSSGSTFAATLWSKIMTEAHSSYEARDFEKPQGIVTKTICIDSGNLVTDLCKQDPRGSRARTEIFVEGTEPTDYCDVHVQAEIDTTTGKLATEYCPPETREFQVFIKRTPPYNPEDHNGIVPQDYQYTLPTETCDVHTEPIPDDTNDSLFDWLFNRPKEKDKDADQRKNEKKNKKDTSNETSDSEKNIDEQIIDDIFNDINED